MEIELCSMIVIILHMILCSSIIYFDMYTHVHMTAVISFVKCSHYLFYI